MIRFTNVIQEIFALLKKASHLASDGDKINRDLLFYMIGQSGQLDGHRGEDRKAVHSCEYPGSAQPLAVKLPV